MLTIDHIGYAVKRIDRAIETFRWLGFSFDEEITEDVSRNIRIAFGVRDGYRIELVCPLNKKTDSPVDSYLSKVGSTPYHICYASDDFDEDIEILKKKGFKVVLEPAEAVAFEGKRVVFLMDLGLGLMEIVEE